MTSGATVYVCDDEEHVRHSLRFFLREHGLSTCAHESGPAFLAMLDAKPRPPRGVLLLDVRMDPMSGPQLHDQLIARGLGRRMPIIYLSGHGNIPLAVEAMNKGAHSFLEKTCERTLLIERVREASLVEERWHQVAVRRDDLLGLLESLSPTQRRVMKLIVAGKLNKNIGDDFDRSERWAEDRRKEVFSLTKVGCAAELATLAADMRSFGLEP